MRIFATTLIGLVGLAALPAAADQTYYELDLSAAYDWRGGNGLNSSGSPLREIEEFELGGISALANTRFDNGVILQGRLRYDHSFAETELFGWIPSGDSYRNGSELAVQGGQMLGAYYLGGFASLGQVNANPWDDDQDAGFASFGVQAAWYGENWSLSGTLGSLDTWAEDPEVIDNAVMVGLSGAYYFNGGATSVGASVTKLAGEQDTDSGSGPDPVDVWTASIEIEHLLRDSTSYAMTVYGGFQWIEAREQSSSGFTEIVNDRILNAGVRIQLGNRAAAKGPRAKTPPLPDMLRAIGAVPAVD
ncbi:hypothetical protein N6L24_08915 [Cognatishimia sp. SS12]|uniref:hypothetical protein n=1 Tax=Cognatishimia sp. SS12 TaxID=2979465 RepID=UPI00232F12E4|nr:hypothetical protein [Cognatishimia sp. SS12]MDC0738401.1 hypothetical protein [Cognatishimia sp. SS12]